MKIRQYSKNLSLYFVSGVVAFTGLEYLYMSLENAGRLRETDYSFVNGEIYSVLIGIGLLYISFNLLKRLYRAWVVTIGMLLFGLVSEVFFAHDFGVDSFLLLALPIALLLWRRDDFRAQSEKPRLQGGLLVAAMLLAVTMLYGTIGFMRIDSHYHRPISVARSLGETLREFSLGGNQVSVPHSRTARTFRFTLEALGFSSFVLAVYTLLKPLTYRAEAKSARRQQVMELAERYGGNSEDCFKFWPDDKDYLLSPDGHAAVAYKVSRGVALSAGDPIGDPASFEAALQEFSQFCRKHAFAMTFVHVGERHKALYAQHALKLQKLGEEAVVELEQYATRTCRNKKWRNVINRFQKLGYSFELRTPPHSATLLKELRRVSDDWLTAPGRTERGFVLGYFDYEYLANCTIGFLRNEEKQIVSFVNLVESYDVDEANMDLLRQRSDSPSNTNDYLLHCVLLAVQQQGFTRFNLGLCPLVGLKDRDAKGPVSSALNLVYSFGGKLYSFKGLYQFKAKFDPSWRTSYLAYEPNVLGLLKIAQALNAAMKVRSDKLS
ncbi:MAG: phosphatidylglycerol lysyltransferase domain-containing protein [Candidatus Saccharimonadales bacterium]